MTNQLVELMKNVPVEQLASKPKSNEMIVLSQDESVLSALKKIGDVGVVQGNENSIIDSLDILAYIVDLFNETDQHHGLHIVDRMEIGGKLSHEKISSICNFAHSQCTSVKCDQSLYDACKMILENKSHRCVVVDQDGNTMGVLNLASIVNFFAIHIQKLGDMRKSTIRELQLGTRPVITVQKQTRTIEAFKLMRESKISGLGVVDATGILIGNLSARDLKHIDSTNIYSSMYMNASNFVQRVRSNVIDAVHPAISCTSDTDLEFVIGRLRANHIHRLYICEKDLHPVGVISLRDVIGCVIGYSSEA